VAIPERRKSDNHILSIYKHVKDNFEDPQSADVNYGDVTFDASSLDIWVDISILSHGAGRKGETLVQFDVYSRVRGPMPGGDEYGEALSQLADALYESMHVDGIQVYDFTVPASPVLLSGAKLMVQNGGGTFREPESDQTLDIEDGVARRSLTYRLRMVEDASRAFSYYD